MTIEEKREESIFFMRSHFTKSGIGGSAGTSDHGLG
jgi:hypothetical protein